MTDGCYIRGDFYVCPNALSYDSYNMCELNCSFCFIKVLEEGWLHKKTIGGLKQSSIHFLHNQLSRAFDSDKPSKDMAVNALRAKLPVIIGRKSEPFCPSERLLQSTSQALEKFHQFGVTAIPETREVEGVFKTITNTNTKGVSLSIPFGNEYVHHKLDPEAPSYDLRFELAKELKASGIWVGLITEPLIPTVNDKLEFITPYLTMASEIGVDHVNFGELKVSSPSIAFRRFQHVGLNLGDILRASKRFVECGNLIIDFAKLLNLPVSSPDWVNFGSENSYYGCCGLDRFGTHNFTFQKAVALLENLNWVTIDNMKSLNIFGEEALVKFTKIWNDEKKHYTPSAVEGIKSFKDNSGNLAYKRGGGKPFGDMFTTS